MKVSIAEFLAAQRNQQADPGERAVAIRDDLCEQGIPYESEAQKSLNCFGLEIAPMIDRLLVFLSCRFSASRVELLIAFGRESAAMFEALHELRRAGKVRGYGSTFRATKGCSA